MGHASDDYIQRLANADPAANVQTGILFDTNVMMEIYTVADLLKLGDELGSAEAALASPRFRWRQERSKHSTILAWHVARQRKVVGVLGGEVIALLERIAGKPEPGHDGTSYVLAAALIRVVRECVLIPNGWREGGLTEVDHRKEGTQADNELLRIAVEAMLPLVTWEGYTEGAFSTNPKSLRNKAKAAGVKVYTPTEYLESEGVNVEEESHAFVAACVEGVRVAKANGMLGGHEVVDDIVPLYRFILLGEVEDAFAHVPRPS
jgi:hypothetical protein